jgi:hypothetical protein
MNSIPFQASGASIAGHALTPQHRSGGMLTLHIDLRGDSLVALARRLAKLEGVRVTGGPEGADRQRSYLVHCQGFKMVLSGPADQSAGAASDFAAAAVSDFALALVSRTPPATLAVTSDLASILDQLMTEPPPLPEPAPVERQSSQPAQGSSLRRSSLKPGKPLSRKTQLTRKTPLARGRFKRF